MKEDKSRSRSDAADRLPWAFGLLCLLVFVIHFGMTVLYTAPSVVVPGYFRALSEAYMEPAFYQGWSLFAPDVQQGYTRLEYRNPPGEGEWIATENVGKWTHSKLREISFKVNHYLEYELNANLTYDSQGNPKTSLVEASGYYKMAAYLCRAHAQMLRGNQMADSIEMRLIRTRIAPPGGGCISSQDTILFPSFSTLIGIHENVGD
jgi:hypothetical protein